MLWALGISRFPRFSDRPSTHRLLTVVRYRYLIHLTIVPFRSTFYSHITKYVNTTFYSLMIPLLLASAFASSCFTLLYPLSDFWKHLMNSHQRPLNLIFFLILSPIQDRSRQGCSTLLIMKLPFPSLVSRLAVLPQLKGIQKENDSSYTLEYYR